MLLILMDKTVRKRESSAAFLCIVGKMIVLGIIIELLTVIGYITVQYSLSSFPLLKGPGFLLLGFFITMTSLLSLSRIKVTTYTSLHIYKAIALGLVQGLSNFPGVSRFGMTYVVARHLGISPRRSCELSMLIHFPLTLGGFFLGLATMPSETTYMAFGMTWYLLIGASSLLSILLLRWMYSLAKQRQLWRVGYYMIGPVLLSTLLFLRASFF